MIKNILSTIIVAIILTGCVGTVNLAEQNRVPTKDNKIITKCDSNTTQSFKK